MFSMRVPARRASRARPDARPTRAAHTRERRGRLPGPARSMFYENLFY